MAKTLLAAVLVFLTTQVFAQTEKDYEVIDYTSTDEYYIQDIKVSGVKYLDKEILSNLSGLREGERITIPGERITKAINNLWSQGLFSDVNIYAQDFHGDTITLNIALQELPRMSEFKIKGIKQRHIKDIKKDLALEQGNQLTENVINNIREAIKEYFYDKKYLNTEIDIRRVDDTARVNRVKVIADVDKHEKVKIKDIVFEGNTVFNDRELRRAMEHTHKKNWNIFQGSKFIPEKYEEDKKKIINKYRKNGYRDAEILGDTVYSVSEKRIMIRVRLNEGDQYYFRNINWTGNTRYPAEALNNQLKIEKGDPFDRSLLNKRINMAEDAVGNLYLDRGYLFFNAQPVITNIDNDSVDVQIRLHEGKQARLDRVIITGNTKTHEEVIRRELRTKPGDLFNKSAIQRSQRELAQLGHFDPEQMGIEPTNINQSRGEVDLQYSVVEKPNDQLEISGGWGAGMLVGTIGVRFNNFSVSRLFEKDAWNPVPTGEGQSLSIRARTNGQYYKNYSISFTEPWLGGKKPNRFSVSLYHSSRTNANIFYKSGDKSFNMTGASVSLQRRLSWPDDYFQMGNALSFKQYNLNEWSNYFIIEDGTSNNLSLTSTLSRNSISQPIYPRRGSKFSLSIEVTPPFSLFKEDEWWTVSSAKKQQIEEDVMADIEDGKDVPDVSPEALVQQEIQNEINSRKYKWVEYHKWKFKSEWYLKLFDDLVLATNGQFGYLGYYDQQVGFSPFGSFDLGGDGLSGYNLYGRETIALRGYENSSLTPIINGKKAGNIYEKVNMELRYPISLKRQATIYVLGFIEAGNAWYNFEEFDPFYLKRSAGVGVRAFLPMFGKLGIDWGYGFDEIEGRPDANGGHFHFVIGQQF
jgi:outer membrane protein insertion porin family